MPTYRFKDVYVAEITYSVDAPDENTARHLAAQRDTFDVADVDFDETVLLDVVND